MSSALVLTNVLVHECKLPRTVLSSRQATMPPKNIGVPKITLIAESTSILPLKNKNIRNIRVFINRLICLKRWTF